MFYVHNSNWNCPISIDVFGRGRKRKKEQIPRETVKNIAKFLEQKKTNFSVNYSLLGKSYFIMFQFYE